MNKYLLLLFFFLSASNYLFSQQLDIVWDTTFTIKNCPNCVIHDLIETNNGRMIGVGEGKDAAKRTFPVVYLFSENGILEGIKTYGVGQGLRALTQTFEGSIVAVGWSSLKSSIQSDGWIIKIDNQGNFIQKDSIVSVFGNECFTKVTTREDGKIIIAGYKNQLYIPSDANWKNESNNGHIWLLGLDRKKKLFEPIEIGKGELKNIMGIVPLPNNMVMFCGNTKRTSHVKDGNVWIAYLDKENQIKFDDPIGGKDWDEAISISTTLDGNLLLAGETWNKSGTESADAWLAEINTLGQTIPDTAVVSTEKDEYGLAGIKLPGNKYAMVVSNIQKDKELVLINHQNTKLNARKINKSQKWNILKIQALNESGHNFLIVGNTPDGIRIMKVRDTHYLAFKSTPSVFCTIPALDDENQDNVIAPNERGALVFNITNQTNADIANIKLATTVKKPLNGLTFQSQINVGYLSSGKNKVVALPVIGEGTVADGTALVEYALVSNGQILCTNTVQVRGVSKTIRLSSTSVSYKSPDPAENGGKTVFRSESKQFTIKYSVKTPTTQLTSNDVKIYQNGQKREDSKAYAIKTIGAQYEDLDGGVIYNFETEVTLDSGINEISIWVEGEEGREGRSIPIQVEFIPEKPTMHVVMIAPDYTGKPNNLKYNKNDVLDLEKLMTNQNNNLYKDSLALYQKIIIHKLVAESETRGNNIKEQFQKLLTLWKSPTAQNRIAPKDVLLVFYSGHGRLVDGNFYIDPSDINNQFPEIYAVDYRNFISSVLNKIECKKIVLLDACHSGAAKESLPRADDVNMAIRELNAFAKGSLTMTSCSGNEVSYEDDGWQNGAFTEALIEALTNKTVSLIDVNDKSLKREIQIYADKNKDKLLSIEEMTAFLEKRVPDLLLRKFGKSTTQTPYFKLNELDSKLKFWRVASQ